METSHSVRTRPEVSVIVPARNEEASLSACLASLAGQTGVTFEIIVVDDDSTDRTREIAQSFSQISVLPAPPLPAGWTGKNNALSSVAERAESSLAEAKREGAALLSYSPEQEVRGFWERAIMPVIFAELARTYQPSQVSDPKSDAAAANGQYLLVSREAYDAVGGHASVASSLLEDVALARAVKQSGRRIYFRYGGSAVRTRMYRSFAQLEEGWTKNLATLFRRPLRLAAIRLAEFSVLASGTAVAVMAASKGQSFVPLAAGIVAGVV